MSYERAWHYDLIFNPDRGHFGFADGGVELLDAFGDDFVLLDK